MTRIGLIALALWVFAMSSGQTQMMMMSQEQLSLPDVQDCPIEKPFSPQPEKVVSNAEGTTIVYPMNGYLIHRIEFIGLKTPADLEITWVPQDEPERWGTKSAELSIKSSDECRFNWFFAPDNVPTRKIEVRSRGPISGLIISFSDKTWDHEGTCSAKELCPKVISSGKQCEARPHSSSCDTFLVLFKKLTEREQCKRRIDFSPVPAIWVCDELQQSQVMASSINILKKIRKLRNNEAISFYGSQEFKSILDGAFLEDYFNGR
jgi:hypothetical protein